MTETQISKIINSERRWGTHWGLEFSGSIGLYLVVLVRLLEGYTTTDTARLISSFVPVVGRIGPCHAHRAPNYVMRQEVVGCTYEDIGTVVMAYIPKHCRTCMGVGGEIYTSDVDIRNKHIPQAIFLPTIYQYLSRHAGVRQIDQIMYRHMLGEEIYDMVYDDMNEMLEHLTCPDDIETVSTIVTMMELLKEGRIPMIWGKDLRRVMEYCYALSASGGPVHVKFAECIWKAVLIMVEEYPGILRIDYEDCMHFGENFWRVQNGTDRDWGYGDQ